MGNITQLKQGSLNGLRRQVNECLDNAYNKGYEDGKKEPREVKAVNVEDTNEYKIGYNTGKTVGYNSAINDYNAMYEWLHDCFTDFEKFLLEKGFYTDEKFLDGFVVGQLMYELICDHDIAEVIAEFKKWQDEKKKAEEEIKVGDIVIHKDDKIKGVVYRVEDGLAYGTNCYLNSFEWATNLCTKVGHIDEMKTLLDKLRGEEE